MRSIWRGAISFGLVNIPIKLYTATEEKRVRFRLLHDACGTPIRYAKMCPACEVEVEQGDLVRGYELDKGRFVRMEDEELSDLPVESTHTIEIVRFVQADEIDPVYFDRSYYAEPAEGGLKPYRLLAEAMTHAGRSALSKVSLRSREQLATVRTYRSGLLLETMHWPDEIRSAGELAGFQETDENVKLSDKEMEMASALLGQLEGPFDPSSYEDEYRAAVERRIAQKVEGNEIVDAGPTHQPEGVVDLMAALEASLKRAENKPTRKRKSAKAPAPTPAPAPAPAAASTTTATAVETGAAAGRSVKRATAGKTTSKKRRKT